MACLLFHLHSRSGRGLAPHFSHGMLMMWQLQDQLIAVQAELDTLRQQSSPSAASADLSAIEAELADLRARLAAPSEAAGNEAALEQIAALHLRVDPPNLEEARLPIDAMGLVVDNMGDQLHEGATLTAALQQIRMAYVEVHNQMNPDPED